MNHGYPTTDDRLLCANPVRNRICRRILSKFAPLILETSTLSLPWPILSSATETTAFVLDWDLLALSLEKIRLEFGSRVCNEDEGSEG